MDRYVSARAHRAIEGFSKAGKLFDLNAFYRAKNTRAMAQRARSASRANATAAREVSGDKPFTVTSARRFSSGRNGGATYYRDPAR